MSVKYKYSKRTAALLKENNLPNQRQLDDLEIRFTNCTITYKLKHVETQPFKQPWRKIGKLFGYSFKSLRVHFDSDYEQLFVNCIFNPSDRHIIQEHLKNLETPTIRFIDCKFLRRDSNISEALNRSWRKYRGMMVKFSGRKGFVDVENDVIRLKDIPVTVEFIIIHGKDALI